MQRALQEKLRLWHATLRAQSQRLLPPLHEQSTLAPASIVLLSPPSANWPSALHKGPCLSFWPAINCNHILLVPARVPFSAWLHFPLVRRRRSPVLSSSPLFWRPSRPQSFLSPRPFPPRRLLSSRHDPESKKLACRRRVEHHEVPPNAWFR